MKIRYLHLSDLHLTSIESKGPVQAFNQDVVSRSMVTAIKNLGLNFDFIVVGGDIARTGQADEYEVCLVFCDALLEATGLDRQRLFIVPGNHDVDRLSITKKHIKSFYSFDDQDEITETFTDPDIFPILMRKFEGFNAFAAKAMGPKRFEAPMFRYVETIQLTKAQEACRITLTGLNSCLFAGYDGDEQQKLALGLYQVNQALERVIEADLKIAFFHHPFFCYHPCDKVCRNLLVKNFDLILTGHFHDPSNLFMRDAAGQAVIIGAGAGFETREHHNSFNLVELDTANGSGRVQFYKYLPDHNHWKKDTDVNPDEDDGCFTFKIGKQFGEKTPKKEKQKPPYKPSTIPYKEERYLDAAMPEEVIVGKEVELLTLIRLPDSEGLRRLLGEHYSQYQAQQGDVRSSERFPLEFPIDENGDISAVDLWICIETSHFTFVSEPRKKIRISPTTDSPLCTFLLKALKSGDLSLLIQVYWIDTLIASGFLRTNGLTKIDEGSKIIKKIITFPLGIFCVMKSVKRPTSERRTDVKDSRVGVIGDDARIEGGIHFHGSDGEWENFYLRRLIARCDPMDLAVMEETYQPTGPNGELPMIRVSDVFTTLYLKYPERRSDQTVKDAIEKRDTGDHLPEKERIPIQAVEAAAAVRKIVMLGRPGGGKSTLVNYVAAQLARRRLGRQAEGPSLFGWPDEDMPLPVRIILRRMAAWITDEVMKGTEGLVWKYLAHLVDEWGCSGFLSSLKRILDQEGGVIFFDGLDEVGEADEARKRICILQALRDFAAPLEKCRVIVTCREYAYRKSERAETANWRLPEAEFPVCEIDLFREEQIVAFARAWYRVTGGQKGWNEKQCLDEADAFHQGIMSSPHLTALGENPLLLTLMAQIHGRLGYLPKDRADLYERAVKLLLAHWENRIVRDTDGTCRIEPWIIMRLGVPVDTLRGPLERVALIGHESQEKDRGDDLSCADIAREDLRQELAAELNDDWNKAEEFIAYVQDRAGLLQAVDNRTFVFPHRTFQEYLAATGIMRKSNFEDVLVERLRRAPSWWQEVFLLAAGSTRDTPRNIYQLLDAVLPEDPAAEKLTAEKCRLAQIAARAIYETDFLKQVKEEARTSDSGRYSKIHRRIQKWLLMALAADTELSPRDRCDAGTAMNWVEDPRFDPENWYLPHDELAGFIKIPAGPFLMGTAAEDTEALRKELPDSLRDIVDRELPQHRVELSEYYIWKYPVTVSQFRVFLEESGHKGLKEWENRNRFDNHPAVDVSWQDAVAYCEWLTERLKERGWRVRLPTEAQWERAARGTKGWKYPWGAEKIDPNRANYGETGINTTSPVGCFPGGISPCGAMDMSGNVDEWCLDWYQNDYYAKSPSRNPSGPSEGSFRVMRGGAWSYDARFCRSALRITYDPDGRFDNLGFRLVLLPGQQG